MSKTLKFLLSLICCALLFIWVLGYLEEGSHGDAEAEPKRPHKKQLNLAYGFSEGWLINHDFYLTNTSGENLSEVHLHITFVGEDASPSLDRYWAAWPLGEREEISIPVGRVTNVQRIKVRGEAEEGLIEASLTPTK